MINVADVAIWLHGRVEVGLNLTGGHLSRAPGSFGKIEEHGELTARGDSPATFELTTSDDAVFEVTVRRKAF